MRVLKSVPLPPERDLHIQPLHPGMIHLALGLRYFSTASSNTGSCLFLFWFFWCVFFMLFVFVARSPNQQPTFCFFVVFVFVVR